MTATSVSTFFQLPHAKSSANIDVGIVGVPWDGGTTSYGRARQGPMEIRKAGLGWQRRYHQQMARSPFDQCRIADLGDLVLDSFDQREALTAIESFFDGFVKTGARPLGLGGDHLITLPILRSLGRKAPVGLVLFDAHYDTADMAGGSKFTSSTPFRRAVEEGVLDPKRMVEIGIRGATVVREHVEWARDVGITIFDMDSLYDMGADAVIQKTHQIVGGKPAYVTFCIDAVDPAFAPGTGVAVPGGLSSYEAIRMIRKLEGLNLIGADIVEFSPPHDIGGITAELSVYLAFEMLTLFARQEGGCRDGVNH